MKRLLTILSAAALFAACGDDDGSGPDTDEPPVVTMFPNTFAPFTTTIRVRGSVDFDFPADAHNVIFERKTGAPADIQATTNTVVRRTFNLAGTFPFECTIHPGMNGEVVVQP